MHKDILHFLFTIGGCVIVLFLAGYAVWLEYNSPTHLMTPIRRAEIRPPKLREHPVVVTVFVAGTRIKPTLYADENGTYKTNPFTSRWDGSYEFWVEQGDYDVRFGGYRNPEFTAPKVRVYPRSTGKLGRLMGWSF